MSHRTGGVSRPRRALLLPLLALLLAACQAPTDPLDAHALAGAAADIASLASEAALLTEQIRAGSVTENFTWVHQEALGRASVDVASRLARPVPPSAQARHEQLLLLQVNFDTALERVGFAANDSGALEQLHGRFQQIRARALQQGRKP